jgi:diketogulonate reductase-like aldo/keto reductase
LLNDGDESSTAEISAERRFQMEVKALGNTSVMVPEIGIGVWRYSGGIEPLLRGIEQGAYLIDTAEVYGTEDVVGRAIRGIRDRVFIATKVSGQHLRYDEVLRAAEASLRRLSTGHIDLYQIHWPNSWIPIQETMRAMETLVDRGLVRYIGVSNFSSDELRSAQAAMTKYPIASNQVLYNLNRREIERDLLPYCLMNRITIMAYTPLDDGRLARPSHSPRSQRMQALELVAAQVEKTRAQVALNWCTSRPNVITIPKSNSEGRVIENCQASGWRLSLAQIQFLDAAFS